MSDQINSPDKNDFRDSVRGLPDLPGVYLFRNVDNSVIYVGKAKNLKKRVSSYFFRIKFDTNKIRLLVRQITKIDHIVVDTESDALLLENNLIKEYKPRYNVLLKDDKSFPYICIKNEPFPRVFATRNPVKDGSVYFGPYTSVFLVRTVLELIRQIYPLRNCNLNLNADSIVSGKYRVCLEYHIGNCNGPCIGKQSESDYEINIRQIKKILGGNIDSVRELLKERMREQAATLEYEEAQKTKEKIGLLEKYQSKSTIVSPAIRNLDIVSFIDNSKYAVANFVKVVNGAVVKSRTLEIKKVLSEDRSDLLSLVITEFRSSEPDASVEMVVPFIPAMVLDGVKFTVPRKGDKKKLLDLSERNARYYMLEKESRLAGTKSAGGNARILKRAAQELGLEEIPVHIECFDNSNIQGSNPVSACVVFRNGVPCKAEYRHYNIKTVSGPDDYASMKEVIFRRYRRQLDEKAGLPQLIVVDGGKGQLRAAVDVIESLGVYGNIRIIAIAKRLEEIYLPDDPVPVYLDKQSETLKLIQYLRNEAHRFSLMFHRQKRSSHFARSVLESVPGLGAKTIEKLYMHFKTYDAIVRADGEELRSLIGITRTRILLDYLSGLR